MQQQTALSRHLSTGDRNVKQETINFVPTDYDPYDFANRRHIGPSPREMQEMLAVLGVETLDALIDQTVPAELRQKTALDVGEPLSERELIHQMRQVAKKK